MQTKKISITTLTQENTISYSQRIIDDILDHALELILKDKIHECIEHLAIRLGKLINTHGSNEFKNWIKEYCLAHPIAPYLMQSPFTSRCQGKPRGYAGDAVLIDYIYRIGDFQEPYTELGNKIHQALIYSSCCESVRWRAQHIASELNSLYETKGRKISAISIASGHLRELNYIQDFDSKFENFVGLDQDTESNQEAKKSYPHKNLYIFDESIKFVLSKKLPQEAFDMVYSTGLFDYLEDKLAARMTQRMFELVAPGGTMIIPNFAIGLPEQGYMESFMDWSLIYRNEYQVMDFLQEIDPRSIAHSEVYTDLSGNILYLKVRKTE